jgi:DNA-binding winged helix-turn-helix (wHTH) protein
MRVAFNEFVLDTARRQLFRGGDPLHLEPKALELLELLVERRPEAVSKGEIHRRLWPDSFVTESSLTGLVAQVRKALGEDGRRDGVLRTVHRFGYAFHGDVEVPPVRPVGPPARIVWEDAVYALKSGENVLGRAEEATVRIEAPDVSRRHARIVIAGEEASIEDLGSKNGTFVGEERIGGPVPLRDGDRFLLGGQVLVFRRSGPAANTWTEAPPRSR